MKCLNMHKLSITLAIKRHEYKPYDCLCCKEIPNRIICLKLFLSLLKYVFIVNKVTKNC